jgi:hypothetical protein
MEAEIALMEAKLTGNKELEESLRQQADFQAALEKTGSFETAANFSATKAAERAAQQTTANKANNAVSPMPSSGGLAPRPRNMRDLAAQGDVDAMTAQLRQDREQARYQDRINRALNEGRPRTASQLQNLANEAAQRREGNFGGLQNLRDQGLGNNFGEGFRNFRDMFGLDTNDLIRSALGKDFDPQKPMQENFKDLAKNFDPQGLKEMLDEQAKPEEARKTENRQNQPPGGGGDNPDSGVLNSIKATLEQFKASMEKRLPQQVMGV